MTTQTQLEDILQQAGMLIEPLPLIKEYYPATRTTRFHCQWLHKNGRVLCKSVGGQSHTHYEWSFIPRPLITRL